MKQRAAITLITAALRAAFINVPAAHADGGKLVRADLVSCLHDVTALGVVNQCGKIWKLGRGEAPLSTKIINVTRCENFVRSIEMAANKHLVSRISLVRKALRLFVTYTLLTASLAFAHIAYQPSRAIEWNNVALQAVRDTKMGPPMVARALAIVHMAEFDAWAAYNPRAKPTLNTAPLKRPAAEHTQANKEIAVSYAAYRALNSLFPSEAAKFAAKMSALGLDPNYTASDPGSAAGIGNAAALSIIASRNNDGANQLGDLNPGAYSDYTGYEPVNTPANVIDPNLWQPIQFCNGTTPPYLAPHWGLVRPFALTSASQFRPRVEPALYPSWSYERQARYVVDVSAALDDRKKVIAEYWADGPASETPPGHWNLLAQFVARRDGHDLDRDVKLFFALNGALLDASIATWEAKRFWDSVRPITAIRFLYNNQPIRAWGGPGLGTQTILGQNWQPYQPCTFITPPFPEHTSGHSAFSMAAAEILARFTRSERFGASATITANSSQTEAGVPAAPVTLEWVTLKRAAREAGASRIYGGIHFQNANVQGQILGEKVGAFAWKKASSHFAN